MLIQKEKIEKVIEYNERFIGEIKEVECFKLKLGFFKFKIIKIKQYKYNKHKFNNLDDAFDFLKDGKNSFFLKGLKIFEKEKCDVYNSYGYIVKTTHFNSRKERETYIHDLMETLNSSIIDNNQMIRI